MPAFSVTINTSSLSALNRFSINFRAENFHVFKNSHDKAWRFFRPEREIKSNARLDFFSHTLHTFKWLTIKPHDSERCLNVPRTSQRSMQNWAAEKNLGWKRRKNTRWRTIRTAWENVYVWYSRSSVIHLWDAVRIFSLILKLPVRECKKLRWWKHQKSMTVFGFHSQIVVHSLTHNFSVHLKTKNRLCDDEAFYRLILVLFIKAFPH